MKTYLENPSNSEMVACMEARYVANYHKRRTEVRHVDKGFIVVFPNKKNKGTFVSAVEPVYATSI